MLVSKTLRYKESICSFRVGRCKRITSHRKVHGIVQIDWIAFVGHTSLITWTLHINRTLSEIPLISCTFTHVLCLYGSHGVLSFLYQIPVFKGAAKPILGNNIDAGSFHGQDGLGDAPDPNAPGLELVQKEGAVSAMIRIVNENPGEVRSVRELCLCAFLSGLQFLIFGPSAGVSRCHGTTYQPGSCCEVGSISTKQTPRTLHHGRQHRM